MAAEATGPITAANLAWLLLGIPGGLLFYGRFYVQWLVSEMKKRSVMPTMFWYMSLIGSPMLLTYAFIAYKPLGALSQCVNLIIYARNVNHIWKEQKRFGRRARHLLQGAVAVVSILAWIALAVMWRRHYAEIRQQSAEKMALAGLWLGLWALGQVGFSLRFLIQWAATERRRKSVVPNVFWMISLAAASLQTVAFTGGQEYLFALGTFGTLPVYVRNLILIYRAGPDAAAPPADG